MLKERVIYSVSSLVRLYNNKRAVSSHSSIVIKAILGKPRKDNFKMKVSSSQIMAIWRAVNNIHMKVAPKIKILTLVNFLSSIAVRVDKDLSCKTNIRFANKLSHLLIKLRGHQKLWSVHHRISSSLRVEFKLVGGSMAQTNHLPSPKSHRLIRWRHTIRHHSRTIGMSFIRQVLNKILDTTCQGINLGVGEVQAQTMNRLEKWKICWQKSVRMYQNSR